MHSDNLYLLEAGLRKLWSMVSSTKRAGLIAAYFLMFPESDCSSHGDAITKHTPTASGRCLVVQKLSFYKEINQVVYLVTEQTAEIKSECK